MAISCQEKNIFLKVFKKLYNKIKSSILECHHGRSEKG
nr:MAG TPA: hypothetical protein [Caudoviricetes sp.]